MPISDKLSLSIDTVCSHLKHVFEKLHVTRALRLWSVTWRPNVLNFDWEQPTVTETHIYPRSGERHYASRRISRLVCFWELLLRLQNVKPLRITWINHIGGQIYGAVPVKGVG